MATTRVSCFRYPIKRCQNLISSCQNNNKNYDYHCLWSYLHAFFDRYQNLGVLWAQYLRTFINLKIRLGNDIYSNQFKVIWAIKQYVLLSHQIISMKMSMDWSTLLFSREINSDHVKNKCIPSVFSWCNLLR